MTQEGQVFVAVIGLACIAALILAGGWTARHRITSVCPPAPDLADQYAAEYPMRQRPIVGRGWRDTAPSDLPVLDPSTRVALYDEIRAMEGVR